MAWSDIAKSAPNGAGPSLHIDLAPLSQLARQVGGMVPSSVEKRRDPGYSPLGHHTASIRDSCFLVELTSSRRICIYIGFVIYHLQKETHIQYVYGIH